MNFRVATAGLLCLLSACSVPFAAAHSTSRTTDRARTDSAETATAADPVWAPAPQYAPSELFMKKHGEFILRSNPWSPDLAVSISSMSDAELKHADGDFNLAHAKVGLGSKVYVDDDVFLNLGLDYGQRDYTFGDGVIGAHNEELTRASATLGFGTFLDDSTLLEANFEPGAYSDFSGTLNHGDWQLYGNSLLTIQYDRSIYMKVGIEYSGLFRDTDVYPLVGVSLIMDDTFRFDLLAPKRARLTADLSESSSLNLSLDLVGDEYQIRPPQRAQLRRTINVQELELTIGGSHRINKRLSLHARVGTTLLGDYYWRDESATNEYRGSLEPQLFGEIGLGWTF